MVDTDDRSDAPPAPIGRRLLALARPSTQLEPAAWLALLLLAGLWSWWAWKQGAYFGTVLLPGTVVLCAGAGLLIRFAPWRAALRLSPPAVVALAALIALGCWALLSAVWSPTPDIAIGDGQRMLTYAIAFGLGIALCNLLGARMNLSLAPLAIAGGIVGALTVYALLTSSSPRDVLEGDGTLDYPLGYRNAEAAFFAVALFPALGLALDRALGWRARGAALATATLCIELVLLAQSRASLPAMVVALTVYLLFSPQRVRALSWLALAVLPAIVILPALESLFSASGDGISGVSGEIRTAGVVALVTTAVAAVLGALAARNEERLPGLGRLTSAGNRGVARLLAGLAGTAVVVFIAAVGNPVSWTGDRLDEFRDAGTPDLSDHASRFGFNAGSNRYDAWRVALSDAGDDPLFGDGGGGYQFSYLRKRDSATQNLHDAHSVELELLSELGIVGLGLFVISIGAAVAGARRSRPLGPSAQALTAVALASASYWLIHTSVDWFWPYPAVTAPVLALLGSACAPAVRGVGRRSTRPWRRWAIVALALLALSTAAPFLAQRYVSAAYAGWRADPARAFADLDHARDLNRLSDTPPLAEGSIAEALGDRERALAAYREAAELTPEEYATHYLIAKLEANSNPRLARNEIRVALELNPLDAQVRRLALQVGISRSELEPLPD
jgi:hypothetical protein